MKQKEFDQLCLELFAPVLEPHGFSAQGSKYCTFHRKLSADIYNVVIPDMGSRGVWFDVKVAPVSPKLDPLFESKFPDSIGMFTPNLLSKYDGVGITQQQFNCKYEENLRRVFKNEVEPLLREKAIPYLDSIKNLEDLMPFIRHDLIKGLLLFELGRIQEARPLLEQQQRLLEGNPTDDAAATVAHLAKILQ